LIYFACHGMVCALGQKEEGYLLTYDADPDNIVTRGIAMGDLVRWVDAIEARSIVIVLDCCHSGNVILPQGATLRSSPRDIRISPSILEKISGKGRFVFASCGEGERSIESPDLGHGLFTYYLLKGIAGEADRDHDGKVGLAELSHYVSAKVANDAKTRFNLIQTPWTSGVWSDDIHISEVGSVHEGAEHRPALEQEWDEKGPSEAIRKIEAHLTGLDEEARIEVLRFLEEKKHPASSPILFRCLADRSEAVRKRARKAVQVIGWGATTDAIIDLARTSDDERVGFVLEGLAALEAHRDVVDVLDRLTQTLKGKLHDRAFFLLERKRLVLDLEDVSDLFRAQRSSYQVDEVLGQGLFTSAYLGKVKVSQLPVVIRILRREYAMQPQVRKSFLDLSIESVRFVHQNLVLTRDIQSFPEIQVYFTVRDYIQGTTLREVLGKGKVFDPPQIVKILRQLLAGLTPLHEASAPHGGIKPSNIFIDNKERIILGDSSLPLLTVSTDTKRLAYDFRYHAPELSRSDRLSLGPQSDYYSLGCVAYELACGGPPFRSDNHFDLAARHQRDAPPAPSRAGSRLGAAGDEFIMRLLAKSPEARFATLDEANAALDRLQAAIQGPSDPGTGAGPSRPVEPQGPRPLEGASGPAGSPEAPPAGERSPGPESSVQLFDDRSLSKYKDLQSLIAMHPQDTATVNPADTGGFGASLPGDSTLPQDADAGQSWADRARSSFTFSDPEYEILEELGHGGMGVVYKARHRQLNRLVALKLIGLGGYANRQQTARFRIEAQAVAQLLHPNIVQIYAIGESNGVPFLAFELLEGGSLAKRLRAAALPGREAAKLVFTLSQAIHAAHEAGVIHRDLKPSNVLFDRNGVPKIVDFGMAKRLETDENLTRMGEIMGTPSYMAPEQARGRIAEVGPSVDIYSLGAILYEMLTGRPPFKASSIVETIHQVVYDDAVPPSRLQPGISRDLETICLKCLAKEPARRYASAQDLADDLQRYLEDRPIHARRTPLLERAEKWLRRRPAAATLLALGLVLVILGVLVLLALTGRAIDGIPRR
jgi:serine/threonine protein kinase